MAFAGVSQQQRTGIWLLLHAWCKCKHWQGLYSSDVVCVFGASHWEGWSGWMTLWMSTADALTVCLLYREIRTNQNRVKAIISESRKSCQYSTQIVWSNCHIIVQGDDIEAPIKWKNLHVVCYNSYTIRLSNLISLETMQSWLTLLREFHDIKIKNFVYITLKIIARRS